MESLGGWERHPPSDSNSRTKVKLTERFEIKTNSTLRQPNPTTKRRYAELIDPQKLVAL